MQTIDELEEELMYLTMQCGDIEAEHLGECARFGDSWPGAQMQIAAFKADIRERRAELENRKEAFVGPVQMTEWEFEHKAHQAMINFVGPELPVPF